MKKLSVYLCVGLFLLSGLALVPGEAAATSFSYTIDFANPSAGAINLGHTNDFAIDGTGEVLNVTAWGLPVGETSYEKDIAQVNVATAGAGIGVADDHGTTGVSVGTPLVAGEREREYLTFALPNSSWWFESVKLDLFNPVEDRTGWIEVSLAGATKSQIVANGEANFHGMLNLIIDPTEDLLQFLSYPTDGNPNLWIGSFVMPEERDNMYFYVSEVTVGVVPEPATMLLLGCGLIGLAGLGRKKFFKKS